MDFKFENLEKIDDIIIKLNTLESKMQSFKRWLSTTELSKYIPYSKETINKKVQNEELICGIHFYQNQKIRMFDKLKIDEWIMNNELSKQKKLLKEQILNKIASNI